jgi:hypothetical protein
MIAISEARLEFLVTQEARIEVATSLHAGVRRSDRLV